jgi:hypothetical protein
VRDYLVNMNVPTSLIDKMMSTRSTEIFQLNVKQLQAQLGNRAPGYEEWLIAKCGDITDVERRDYEAVTGLEEYTESKKIVASGKDTSGAEASMMAYLRDKAAYAMQLPVAYRQTLMKKGKDLEKCRDTATDRERGEILEQR